MSQKNLSFVRPIAVFNPAPSFGEGRCGQSLLVKILWEHACRSSVLMHVASPPSLNSSLVGRVRVKSFFSQISTVRPEPEWEQFSDFAGMPPIRRRWDFVLPQGRPLPKKLSVVFPYLPVGEAYAMKESSSRMSGNHVHGMDFWPHSFPVGGVYVKGMGGWRKLKKKSHSFLFSIAS